MAYPKRLYNKKKPSSFTNKVVERKRLENPSEYQTAICSAVAAGCNRLHINALAGCGKTSTSVEIPYYLPKAVMLDSVQVAFNSNICKELIDRVPVGVECKTFHGLCRAALVAAFPSLNNPRKLDNKKYQGYIRAELGDEAETLEVRENLKTLIDRARDCMIYDSQGMRSLLDRFDIQTGQFLEKDFVELGEKILLAGLRDFDRIDFGDMISMTLYHNLKMRQYSGFSVDEAQDMCPSQHEAARRSLVKNGFFSSVGDKNQRIYGWRGADLESIDNLITHFGCREFVLPRTYRCGKAIVESARKYVPELEYPDWAHDGEVIEQYPIQDMIDLIVPGNALLSRINAPLVKWCFAMIRAGIPANIVGRDVAENLKGLIRKSKADYMDSLISWICNWRDSECQRRKEQKRSTTTIEDMAECILTLAEGVFEIRDLVDAIDTMFSDKSERGIVTCSSIHKAKGKEWGKVFLLQDTLFLKNNPDQEEEMNIAYVGETRAKNSLIKVVGK